MQVVIIEMMTREGLHLDKMIFCCRVEAGMDVHTPEQRRGNMSAIKGKNTKPEIVVRRGVHSLGYRFRLHRKDLPGNPDIVLPKHKIAIFVNGCFWHRHLGCRYASTPSTNVDFWNEKFSANVARDSKNYAQLEAMGWNVVVVWECEVNHFKISKYINK